MGGGGGGKRRERREEEEEVRGGGGKEKKEGDDGIHTPRVWGVYDVYCIYSTHHSSWNQGVKYGYIQVNTPCRTPQGGCGG